MSMIYFLMSLMVFLCSADLPEAMSELEARQGAVREQLAPLEQEGQQLSEDIQKAQELIRANAERLQQLEATRVETLNQSVVNIGFEEIKTILGLQSGRSRLNDCDLEVGQEKNEIYVQKNNMRFRVIIPETSSLNAATIKKTDSDSRALYEVVLKDYNHQDESSDVKPMKIEITYTVNAQQQVVVHVAKLRGQAIDDLFFNRDSYQQIGAICIDMLAPSIQR